MESKRQTESVLAKLMGLERPLPRRVLSESYLQDIALISQHHKWSFDRFSMDADDTMLETRDSSQHLQTSSSSEESLERCRIQDKMFQKLWLLSSSQKGYSSRGDSYSQKVESPKKMENAPVRDVLQNHKVGNSHYVQLLSSIGGKAETFSPMRKRVRDCLSGREALGHRSVSTHGIAKQVAQELQHSVWHDCLKAAEPVKAQDSFPRNMNTNNSKSTSLRSSESSKCRTKNLVVHKDWCLNLVSEGSSYCKSSQKVNCKSEEDLKSTSIITSLLHSEKDGSCEETPSTPTDLIEFAERHLFEDYPSVCVLPRDISTYSDVESVSSINKECVNVDSISEQAVDYTFKPLQQSDDGYPLYKMEAYKPNSDAASNIKDISPAAYFSAIHGSEVKLQQSTSTIFYSGAKRHKRIDVRDAEEGGDKNQSGEIITGIYKNEETRALSYLIDVLAESGLQCGNWETCYKLGQPSENPFVFDALENKYRHSKQPSWLKSERRLLFDRITWAFSDILHPSTGINTRRTYKTNRLLFHCNQDMIREELLSVLVHQEKQAKRVSSEKVVGLDCDWLELEEDMQIVVKEIEEVLINELVEEIISVELFI